MHGESKNADDESDYDSDDFDDDDDVVTGKTTLKCGLGQLAEHVLWYKPPIVRSDWNDVNTHFETEWADLFLDLVYVGAAYKLGTVLAYGNTSGGHDPTDGDAIMMFVTLFLAFYHSWQALNEFKSRFMTEDYVHQIMEVIQTINLAFGVSHLRSTAEMRDAQNGHLFWISVVFALDKGIAVLRYVETYVKTDSIASATYDTDGAGVEQSSLANTLKRARLLISNLTDGLGITNPAEQNRRRGRAISVEKQTFDPTMLQKHASLRTRIRNTATRAIWNLAAQFTLPVIAAFIAQISEAQQDKNSPGDDTSSSYSSYYYSFRRLAGSSSYSYGAADDGDDRVTFAVSAPDFVVGLWLTMSLMDVVYYLNIFLGKLSAKKGSVPLHLMYLLHRHGEWLMLLIGESIFSMLLSAGGIKTEKVGDQWEVYGTYFCALYIALLLHFNAFTYESWNPDTHALKRTARAQMAYFLCRNVYYGSILSFGIALKVHMVYCLEESQKAWAWLLFGSSLIWYWSFQISITFHTRKHEVPNPENGLQQKLVVQFPSIQPGMSVILPRKSGRDRSYSLPTEGSEDRKATVTTVHDDGTFDVLFVDTGKMQGDLGVNNGIKVVVKDNHGHPLRWNIKPLAKDLKAGGEIWEDLHGPNERKIHEIRWFSVEMPNDYDGRAVTIEVDSYVTAGFLEYLRQFPTIGHKNSLPYLWTGKLVLSLLSFLCPWWELPYAGNAVVMLGVALGYTVANHYEFYLEERSGHDDHH